MLHHFSTKSPLLEKALAECSFDRLCELYTDKEVVIPLMLNKVTTLVSKADMQQNSEAARAEMEQHLAASLLAGPLNKDYRSGLSHELRSMGGMKINFVAAPGNPHQSSFLYTVGFASFGGKELFLPGHESMDAGKIAHIFKFLFARVTAR